MDPGPIEPGTASAAAAALASAKVAFAALCGGIIRAFVLPIPGETPLQRVFNTAWMIAGCVTCGHYGTQPFMDWTGLPPAWDGAVGALIGMIGMSFAAGTIRAAENLNFKDWLLKLLIRDNKA